MGINFIEGCRQADCLLVLHFESVALCLFDQYNECMNTKLSLYGQCLLPISVVNRVVIILLRVEQQSLMRIKKENPTIQYPMIILLIGLDVTSNDQRIRMQFAIYEMIILTEYLPNLLVAKMSMLIIMEKMLIAVAMKGCFDELMFCCTVAVTNRNNYSEHCISFYSLKHYRHYLRKLVKLFGKQLLFCSNEKTIPVPFYQYPNSAAFKQLMMYAIINRGWGTAALLLSKVESDIVCDKLMQWRRCNQAKNKKDRKRNLEEEIENFPLTVLMKIFSTSIFHFLLPT
ncbi:hypothetical protein T06_16368 [Trichinella sp. T6]|nr:hypothetical protein T06_16368 [Trichinella sp. T6]